MFCRKGKKCEICWDKGGNQTVDSEACDLIITHIDYENRIVTFENLGGDK